MKFRISRTSLYGGQDTPHPSAYRSKLPEWTTDIRTFKTFEEFDRRCGRGAWVSKGRNHRLIDKGIYREVPQDGEDWYIDIDGIEGLAAFAEKEGPLVVKVEDGEMMLEIYDDYRE